MPDQKPQQYTGWKKLAPLIGEQPGESTYSKYTDDLEQQRGTLLGYQRTPDGKGKTAVYMDPNGDKYFLTTSGDPYAERRVYDARTQDIPVPNAEALRKIDQDLALNNNPVTQQRFGDPFQMSVRDRMANHAILQAYNSTPEVAPGIRQGLNEQRQRINSLEALRGDLEGLKNADMGFVAQQAMKLKNITAGDLIAKGVDPTAADRFVDAKQQLDFLKSRGQWTGEGATGAGGKGSGGAQTFIPAGFLSALGLGAVQDAVEYLGSNENLTALRNSIPKAENSEKKDYYDTVTTERGLNHRFGNPFTTDDPAEIYANKIVDDLGTKFNYTDNPMKSSVSKAIAEPAGTPTPEKVDEGTATAPTVAEDQATKTAAPINPVVNARGVTKPYTFSDWWGSAQPLPPSKMREMQAVQGDVPRSPAQVEKVEAEQGKGSREAWKYTTPSPFLPVAPVVPQQGAEPTPWSRLGTSPEQLPQPTVPLSQETGRPGGGAENAEIGSFADTPRLALQEHVDQLPAGRRFVWHHDGQEYVKT